MSRLFPALATNAPWGLERIGEALAELGDPHLSYPTLHVGGTNGKGSVAAILASVLSEAGRRVGLYTSPHLCSFRERILVGGAPVGEDRLQAYADELRPVVTRHGLTFFEAATALGFLAFARECVDLAVIEVGLGGRLDATNVIRPLAAGVTNVALDHAEYLGDSLAGIAAEKVEIAKPGVPLLTAETDSRVLEVFAGVCAEREAPLVTLDHGRVGGIVLAPDHTSFELETGMWGALSLTTPLTGWHQATNAAFAVAMLEHLPGELEPGAEAVRRGVAAVRWPGRGQIERDERGSWLFDVAHNPAGVDSLTAVLDRIALPSPRVALLGVLGDKEWRAMLPPICRRVERAVLTQPPSAPLERRWDPNGVAGALRPLLDPGFDLEVVADFAPALEVAREAADQGTVVVTGSVHTVGDALRLLELCRFPE